MRRMVSSLPTKRDRYIAEGNGWFFSITPSDFIRRWNVNVLCYFPTQEINIIDIQSVSI